MCILALFLQEFGDYPLIVAANRDEHFTRPSAPPQVLLEHPLVFGGKDLVAGGTWLGVNEHGLLAGILNRREENKRNDIAPRSRGLLCLDILKSKDPAAARRLLKQEKGSNYQPFNLLIASAEEAYVAYNIKDEIAYKRLEKGVRVLSNAAIDDSRSEKLDQAYNLFSQAAKDVKENLSQSLMKRLFARNLPVWDQPSFLRLFKGILGNHALRAGSKDPRDAICVHTKGYGTVCSSVIFYAGPDKQFHSYHASTPPCRGDYEKFLSVEVQ